MLLIFNSNLIEGKLLVTTCFSTRRVVYLFYYLSCPERFHVLRFRLTCRLHIGEPVDEVAGVQVSPVFRTNLHLQQTARATCEPHLELSLPFSSYRTDVDTTSHYFIYSTAFGVFVECNLNTLSLNQAHYWLKNINVSLIKLQGVYKSWYWGFSGLQKNNTSCWRVTVGNIAFHRLNSYVYNYQLRYLLLHLYVSKVWVKLQITD